MVQQLEITVHPMEDVATEIEILLEKLKMELDVAPTDRVAHLDLLKRIKNAAEKGQQLAYPENEILLAISASKNDETGEEEEEDWYDPTELITIVEDEEEFAPEIEELRQKGWQIMTKSQMSERVEQLRKEREKSEENSK